VGFNHVVQQGHPLPVELRGIGREIRCQIERVRLGGDCVEPFGSPLAVQRIEKKQVAHVGAARLDVGSQSSGQDRGAGIGRSDADRPLTQ
jgi:hypothetical protein